MMTPHYESKPTPNRVQSLCLITIHGCSQVYPYILLNNENQVRYPILHIPITYVYTVYKYIYIHIYIHIYIYIYHAHPQYVFYFYSVYDI